MRSLGQIDDFVVRIKMSKMLMLYTPDSEFGLVELLNRPSVKKSFFSRPVRGEVSIHRTSRFYGRGCSPTRLKWYC